MSEDIQETNFNHNNDHEENAIYNIESYSEESGEHEADPFVDHYSNLTRQIQGSDGRRHRAKSRRSAVYRESKDEK